VTIAIQLRPPVLIQNQPQNVTNGNPKENVPKNGLLKNAPKLVELVPQPQLQLHHLLLQQPQQQQLQLLQLETFVQIHLDIMPILKIQNVKVMFNVLMEHPMSYLVLLGLSIIPIPFNVYGLGNTNVLEMVEVIQQQQLHLHLLQQLQ
jgi:hypothetical protein